MRPRERGGAAAPGEETVGQPAPSGPFAPRSELGRAPPNGGRSAALKPGRGPSHPAAAPAPQALELRGRANKYLPKINDAWRTVDFPGIGEAPPSWPDEDDKVQPGIGGSREFRAAMNAAAGVPLFGVEWARAAAPAPAPSKPSKKRKGKGKGAGSGKRAK